MVKLKNSPDLRGFRFTVFYTYRSSEGYLAVELAVSDGKHPSKKEITDLAEVAYLRRRIKLYGREGEVTFEPDQLELCVTDIQEFNDSDYFNWIGVGKKLEEEEKP